MSRRIGVDFTDGPVVAGVLLAGACTITFAPDPFVLMIVRAFQWQWVLVAAGLACAALLSRWWWTAAAAGAGTLLMAFPVCTPTDPQTVGAMSRDLVHVAQMNVLQPNDDHADVIVVARSTGADVISFQEVSPAWGRALSQGLAEDYPFHHIVPGSNCYGIALFSRLPFERITTVDLGGHPMLLAEVRTPCGPVRLLCVHATSPGSWKQFRERNAQLDELAALVNDSPVPVVLFGDLNTVSWDHAFRRLCARTGLREHGGDRRATWPSMAGIALIPLDHVLVSRELAVGEFSIFSIPGSDHRGVAAVIRSRS